MFKKKKRDADKNCYRARSILGDCPSTNEKAKLYDPAGQYAIDCNQQCGEHNYETRSILMAA